MDLQQELSRSRFGGRPSTGSGEFGSPSTARTAVVSEAGALPETGPEVEVGVVGSASEPPAHLDAVRLSPPIGRRPVDRLIRLVDLFGAMVGLVLATPILLAAAGAILVSSRGPVVYSQVRVGRDGRSFRCYKLRTMDSDADAKLAGLLDQPRYVTQWLLARKLDDDPRVTRVGRLLRSTDLDELPQLWNVVRGEMSLVGPRPVPADEAERYGLDLAAVLSIRPGMTGMWQVGGRHQVSYDQRIELDVRYVETRGLRLNARLLVRTLGLIALRRNGAS